MWASKNCKAYHRRITADVPLTPEYDKQELGSLSSPVSLLFWPLCIGHESGSATWSRRRPQLPDARLVAETPCVAVRVGCRQHDWSVLPSFAEVVQGCACLGLGSQRRGLRRHQVALGGGRAVLRCSAGTSIRRPHCDRPQQLAPSRSGYAAIQCWNGRRGARAGWSRQTGLIFSCVTRVSPNVWWWGGLREKSRRESDE